MTSPRRRRSSAARTAAVSIPALSLWRQEEDVGLPVGSYNESESVLVIPSPAESTLSSDRFAPQESPTSARWCVQSMSLDFDGLEDNGSVLNEPVAVRANNDAKDKQQTSSKALKAKTTKAERRALQEAQRAAKAVAKGGEPSGRTVKQPVQKKDVAPTASSTAASNKKGADHPAEKEKKRDVPPPRMQFDDKGQVEKAKKRASVSQTAMKNLVELFGHLPQYERETLLPGLHAKFLQCGAMHQAVLEAGLKFLTGDLSGANARCVAMLQAFQAAIKDYSTPPEKILVRDLGAKINSYVSLLAQCRPLSISMGNAIRFLKNRIMKLPLELSDSEAKAALCGDIDRFINEKIVLADKVIIRHAATKIKDGDVILTYGLSSVVEMILLYAHGRGRQFRVVVIDSHPKFEGQVLLRRLLAKGLTCSFTCLNATSHIMHEVTQVLLGASSIMSNGSQYSRVGTAVVAMVANAFRIPVLVCCEAYKFSERVLLNSICMNELGDPDAILEVPGQNDSNHLDNRVHKENILNLVYDVTPSEYISMIITEYGMIPPTSVPVIVREYRREYLWI